MRALIPGLGRLPVALRARLFGWCCLGAWLLLPLFLPGESNAQHGEALAHAAGAVAGWTGARMLGFGRRRRAPATLALRPRGRFSEMDLLLPNSMSLRPQTRADQPAGLPPADFVREVADPILEKLASGGWESLTPRERALLAEASRRLRDRA